MSAIFAVDRLCDAVEFPVFLEHDVACDNYGAVDPLPVYLTHARSQVPVVLTRHPNTCACCGTKCIYSQVIARWKCEGLSVWSLFTRCLNSETVLCLPLYPRNVGQAIILNAERGPTCGIWACFGCFLHELLMFGRIEAPQPAIGVTAAMEVRLYSIQQLVRSITASPRPGTFALESVHLLSDGIAPGYGAFYICKSCNFLRGVSPPFWCIQLLFVRLLWRRRCLR